MARKSILPLLALIFGLIFHFLSQAFVAVAEPGIFFGPPGHALVRFLWTLGSTLVLLAVWMLAEKKEIRGEIPALAIGWISLLILVYFAGFAPWSLKTQAEWLGKSSLGYTLSPLVYRFCQATLFFCGAGLALYHRSITKGKALLFLLPALLGLGILVYLLLQPAPHFNG
ncbi:MAG: hypothetical protein H6581_10175 [Bacteroidia bacterium]|nr:hypothetical protein [Bacteroidia bacterium]